MNLRTLTFSLLFFTSICTAQINFQIDSVKTILNYNENSNYLVVLVHGSGKQDMHGQFSVSKYTDCEFLGYRGISFNIFDDFSEEFFKAGFSTLRYEKINVRDQSNRQYIIQDFVEDLQRILLNIKNHEILGSKKLLLFGWSEGVTVALSQLDLETKIYGIIGFGGVFVDPIQMKADVYYRHIINCEGNEEKALSFKDQILEKASQQENALIEGDDGIIFLVETLFDEQGTEEIGTRKTSLPFTRSYFQDFQRKVIQSNEILSKIEHPVLLIHGQDDVNVPVENHLQLSKTVHNKVIQLSLMEGTDHYFRKDFSQNINPEFFQLLLSWKNNVLDEWTQ